MRSINKGNTKTGKNQGRIRGKYDSSDEEPDTNSQQYIMQSLMSANQFDDKSKTKKKKERKIKEKDVHIDLEDDTYTVLEKVVLTLKEMKDELVELRSHVESSYCTNAEFNRYSDKIDQSIADLTMRVENMEY